MNNQKIRFSEQSLAHPGILPVCLLAISMILLSLIPCQSLAATLKSGAYFTLPADQVIDDNLYVAGGGLDIEGKVTGDVLAAGGQVLVSNDVGGDTTLAGGDISLLGNTAGDARIVGGYIQVLGQVGGDLIVTGAAVNILSAVQIGKDAIISGGSIALRGIVDGDVEISGQSVEIDAHVKGNLNVSALDRFIIGKGTKISGNLTYRTASEDMLVMEDGAAVARTIKYIKPAFAEDEVKEAIFKQVTWGLVILLLNYLLAIIFITWLFPTYSLQLANSVEQSKLYNFLTGLIISVVVPVGLMLLSMTIIGALLASMLFLGYLLLMLLAAIMGAPVFGAWLGKIVLKHDEMMLNWQCSLAGMLILLILAVIPLLGQLLLLAVLFTVLGGLACMVYQSLRKTAYLPS